MWLIINCKAIEYGTFSVEVFDVGQGLSVLIRTNRHNMLVDAGSRYMGQHVVLNVLRQYGINLLDTIIISHGDSDHSAGLVEILKGVKYRTLIAGEPSRMYIKSLECSNTSWEWDGVVFSTYQIRSMQKHNNLSCIVHVQAKGKSILMPGDIEANAENYLLKNTVPGSLHADILLAPHHGSISSGTHAFIKAVAPKIIVVSAGKYKLYKHPAKAHIRFWDQQHIKHLNTHLVGSIKL